ncbi:serine/threonine-protein phosphatase 7 long form homolog [Arachis ipaensis]|uniref:serine/threonine-protein phosphatase 7 long form homolog n=1 Tax=Arachis ipaensis TaxID=130454 RepID=UPI000A2B6BCD|nr:serine/threonine-protein phosphatase 7 long form homolog [Arachis ipaensis]
MPFRKVAYQFGFPVDEFVVSGCLSDFEQLMEGEACVGLNKFRVKPANAPEATIQVYARGYIMMLSTILFADKSRTRVHSRWLPYVTDLDRLGKYSWGSAILSWLYRCLCRVFNQNVKNLVGPLTLLQSWIFLCFPTFNPRGFDTILWPFGSRWSRYLPSSDEKGPRVIDTLHRLDRLSVDDFIWMLYNAFEVIQVVHLDILRHEHTIMEVDYCVDLLCVN